MRLYLSHVMIHLRSIMGYKSSFVLSFIGQLIISLSMFLGTYFLFLRFPTVAEYSFPEVLLCFSLVMMQYSLAEVFARGFDTFPSMIKSGSFDRVLVRPRSEILQVLCSKFELARIGKSLQGFVTLIYAMTHIDMVWTLDKLLTVILMLVGGTCLYIGLFIVYAGVTFFTIEGLEFMNIFTDGAKEFGKYPYDIYGSKVLGFTTFLIPYALTQYYPLTYILGETNKTWFMLLPIVGVIYLIPCCMFFKYGVTKYRSTGS